MRYPHLDTEKISAQQRHILERLPAGTGDVENNPYQALAYAPDVADLVGELDDFLKTGLRIPERLRIMAVLTAAAQHRLEDVQKFVDLKAIEAGELSSETLEAIQHGNSPISVHDDENLVHAFVTELAATGRVGDPVFDRACESFGREICLEMVKICGFTIFINNLMNIAHPPSHSTGL